MVENEEQPTTLASMELLRALYASQNTKEVLLEHAYLCSEDPRIDEAYKTAGYSPVRGIFHHTPQRDLLIQYLKGDQHGGDDFADDLWDVHRAASSFEHRGLLQEMDRTRIETGLMDLDNTSEFLDYPEDPEEMSMAPLWKDDPFTSPQSCKFRGDNATPRSSRGLKRLSRRVKEVVQERSSSTYKDVADDLIRELDQMDISDKDKEEKNIRRRVYDALNVLIAAGVMGKSGKEVLWRGAELCYQPPSESQERLQCSVNTKRRLLQRLADQTVALRALIDRNKKKISIDRISLPSKLVITSGRPDITISSSGRISKVSISALSPSRIVDILELVPGLRLGKVDCVPEEVKRLLAGPRYI